MLKFVLGRAASGKTEYLYEKAERFVRQGQAVCFIVPEQQSMETERALQRKYGDGVEVLSFHRLCDRLMRLYGGGARARIGQVAQECILYRAVRSVQKDLRYYKSSVRNVRFFGKLNEVIRDFAAYKAEPDLVLAALEGRREYDKYHDLFLIYDAYKALLRQDFRDVYDDLDTLCRLLSEHSYFNGKVVMIDSFAGFTRQEYEVIGQIFLQSEHCLLTLTADEGDRRLFAPTLRELGRLTALAERYGLRYETVKCCYDGHFRPGVAALEKYMFSDALPEKRMDAGGDVRVFSADDPQKEVEFVARDIRRRVLGGECRYRDIAVVSNVQEEYRSAVETYFERLDVPLYTDRKVDVMGKPLFGLILHAFDAVRYGYRYEDMISMAKTCLCGMDHDQAARLENYVFLWKIRGKKWEMEWTQDPFGLADSEEPDEEKRREKEAEKGRLLDEINELRKKLYLPLAAFREDTASGSAKDMLAAVWRLTQAYDVRGGILTFAENAADDAEAEEWTRLYDLLVEFLDQLALVLGDTPVTRVDLQEIFEICLRHLRMGVLPAYMDQVTFTDMIRSRVGNVRHIYVLGANNGSFPAAVSGSDIITDRDVRFFKDNHIHLSKDSETVATEQQFCLYRSICGASESVTFTFAEFGAAGDVKLPSSLIRRVTERILAAEIRPVPYFLTHRREILDHTASLTETEREASGTLPFLKEEFGFVPRDLAIREREEKDLPTEVVRALYGTEISASQSRLESFNECPFKFFMTYGLGIEETEPVDFGANYIGSFVHFGMEQLMNAVRDSGDIDIWTDAKVDTFMKDLSRAYYEERLKDLRSPRFDHLFDRISRSMRLAAISAVDELRHSKFLPEAQEYHFTKRIPVSDEFYARVNGFIDRIDAADIDGKRYLRIIDYKTGKKSFSFEKIFNGFQMQLPLYAKMLLEEDGYRDAGIAAMEYFLAGVPEIGETGPDGEISKEQLAKSFSRLGLYSCLPEIQGAIDNTGEKRYIGIRYKTDGTPYAGSPVAYDHEMRLLGRFVMDKTKEIVREIAGGNVKACPMKDGINACEYCGFGGICRFEWGKSSIRKYQKVKKGEFFDKVREEGSES